jgi:bifunctional non-homologous end joining protein LigD
MPSTFTKEIRKGVRGPLPSKVQPMLATLVQEPFDDPSWLYEVKWDGYRIIGYSQKNKIWLHSRSNLDYTSKYPALVTAIRNLPHDVVLDGEVVVLNEQGKPDFDQLQNYRAGDHLIYYVFDLLWIDGFDLTSLRLEERKSILSEIIPDEGLIRYSQHFDQGISLFEKIAESELEGIVAKKRESLYRQGQRGREWLKIPTQHKQEFVIGGWIESEKSRSFRTLLFGAYHNGKLEWIGHAGGGFKESEMPGIKQKLLSLETTKSPFVNKVDTDGEPHWVKPVLVANFKFATYTKSGRIRKPATFLGFRHDKLPKDVTVDKPSANHGAASKTVVRPASDLSSSQLSMAAGKRNSRTTISSLQVDQPASDHPKEIELSTRPDTRATTSTRSGNVSTHNRGSTTRRKNLPTSEDSNWKEVEAQKITSRQEFDIEGCTIELTNVDREIWEGIPKAKLIQYYNEVSQVILPHLQQRPLSLHLKPVNAGAPGLYIKDMEGRQPSCAEVFTVERKHKKNGKRNTIDYLVCNNKATLLYVVNLGCIDVNPWTSRTASPMHPDFIVVDLDPSDEDFQKAVETARAAKQVFDELRLKAFPKTSGKTGIHLFIPCTGFDFEQARQIAANLCDHVHAMVPDITTRKISKEKRGDKLFIDENQNDYTDTLASAYSVRPFHWPCVSTPLEWKELKQGLDQRNFTIDTISGRIEKKGDLFQEVLSTKLASNNSKILKKLLH